MAVISLVFVFVIVVVDNWFLFALTVVVASGFCCTSDIVCRRCAAVAFVTKFGVEYKQKVICHKERSPLPHLSLTSKLLGTQKTATMRAYGAHIEKFIKQLRCREALYLLCSVCLLLFAHKEAAGCRPNKLLKWSSDKLVSLVVAFSILC